MNNAHIFLVGGVFLVVCASLFFFFASPVCGIEQCHGWDITCGPNVPDMCTEEYRAEDLCQTYAGCKVVNNQCTLEKSPKFDICKSCVEKCYQDFVYNKTIADTPGFFDCHANCADQLK